VAGVSVLGQELGCRWEGLVISIHLVSLCLEASQIPASLAVGLATGQ
jgi:hypothetical protein